MYARRRGLGDSIPTCYYYVSDPVTGLPVCGNIGGSPALLPNAGVNPGSDVDYGNITIQEIGGWVAYYAKIAVSLIGGSPGQAQTAGICAQAAFTAAVTPQDVIAGNVSKINSAANAAVQSAYNGACNPGVHSSWTPTVGIDQMTPNRYAPFVYCDDRSSAGAHDCLAVQQIVTGGGFDFASLAAGGATAGGSSAATVAPPAPAPVQFSPQISAPPSSTLLSPYLVAQPLPPVQQQTYVPAPISTLSVPGGGQVYSQQAMNQIYPQAQQAAAVQSQTTAPAGSSITDSVSGALSSLETSASGAASSGLNWVEANPLIAAGIAAAVLFLFMGGRK